MGKDKKIGVHFLIGFTAFIIVLYSIILVVFTYEGGGWKVLAILLVGILGLLASIYSSVKKRYNLAKYILVIVPSYTILLVSLANCHYGIVTDVYAYLIPRFSVVVYVLVPIIFFGLDAKKQLIISLVIIAPTVLLFDYSHNISGIKLEELPYTYKYYSLFFGFFSSFYSIAIISILLYQQINIRYREKINSQNRGLLSENDLFELENQELVLQIQKNKNYEAFIEANHDAVFMLDKIGTQLYFNGQIEKIIGYSKEEMIGKSFTNFVPFKEIPNYFSKLKEVFLKGEVSDFETLVKHKDGGYVPVEINGKILRYEGQLVALGTMRDITQRRKIAQVLEFQSNLYKILNITSKDIKLEEVFTETLDVLFGIESLSVEKKGLIFLTNEQGVLELISHQNCDILEETCAFIKPGQCLCGKALEFSQTIFCNSVGHDHTIQPKGMKPHGHYVVPIQHREDVIGVICLYLEQGQVENENTLNYLETVAQVLARKIISEQRKESLQLKSIELQDKHNLLDTILSELNKSIDYTSFLQNSLLPNRELLDSCLKESCVLFLPRDKVSGDFYFTYQIEELIYFGVGDCTGHGVPGAFLSSMSIETVKSVIHSSYEETPCAILTELKEIAKNRFESNSTNSDSMDMALCVYNKHTEELYYSGGFIDMYIVRNNNTLLEYKATRSPIGAYPIDLPFSCNKVEIKKGDVIYLATDGYVDQFGYKEKGDKLSKLKRKRFKELLLSISHLSCSDQVKELESSLTKWRKGTKQTDDITVFISRY